MLRDILDFFLLRTTERLNTVNLGRDLEGLELVEAVEDDFRIKFTDQEAEAVITVGQMEALIVQKLHEDGRNLDVWPILEQLVREHSLEKDPIDRETTFLREYAKRR